MKTFGPHVVDYGSLNINFLHNQNFFTLQGVIDDAHIPAHLHHIRHMVTTDSMAAVYSMTLVDLTFILIVTSQPDITNLIKIK